MLISAIQATTFNSRNNVSNNKSNSAAKFNYNTQMADQVSFGNIENKAGQKVLETVQKIFTLFDGNEAYKGINEEFSIFTLQLEEITKKLAQSEIFPFEQGLKLNQGINEFGKTKIAIAEKKGPLANERLLKFQQFDENGQFLNSLELGSGCSGKMNYAKLKATSQGNTLVKQAQIDIVPSNKFLNNFLYKVTKFTDDSQKKVLQSRISKPEFDFLFK